MSPADSPRVTVMVCHDCCCGTRKKHPGTNHEAQRAALLALDAGDVRVRVVDCLDECQRSNVVLVRDHALPRRERDTWLGQVLYPSKVSALVEWVGTGGPLPEALARHRFVPPRSARPPK